VDVLLVRAGALGDVLLLRPAVAALRRAGHRVRLLAPQTSGAVLVGPDEALSLLPLDGPGMASLLGGRPIPVDIEDGLHADAALALTRGVALLDAVRPRVSRLLTRDPIPPPGVHAAAWAAEALDALDVPSHVTPAPLAFTDAELEQAAKVAPRLGAGFLALHPGSGATAKNWPADRFAALARALARPGEGVLVVAGPADGPAVAPLRSLPGAAVAEGLPARVLGALLSRAGLYVGNDSGVTHLAAAAGTPTLALFGPTDPAAWAPLGRRVRVVCSSDRSMSGLSLATAAAAARELRDDRAG